MGVIAISQIPLTAAKHCRQIAYSRHSSRAGTSITSIGDEAETNVSPAKLPGKYGLNRHDAKTRRTLQVASASLYLNPNSTLDLPLALPLGVLASWRFNCLSYQKFAGPAHIEGLSSFAVTAQVT